ncbi:hypothetical protein ACFQ9H_33435 [Streptomyces sp. NPDC056517]|uniref:hypothetical protein n=1 Tax=unclassified Streptomyces TaxID=2593676 RepID=UPI0036863F79
MGEITVSAQDMDHLLRDPASAYGAPYQRAYAELAETLRGRPADEIVPLLRTAADAALLGFTRADLLVRRALRAPRSHHRVELAGAISRAAARPVPPRPAPQSDCRPPPAAAGPQ